jgi:hypothetical protein
LRRIPLGYIRYVDDIGQSMRAGETEHGKWLPDRLFRQDPSLPYILADLM